MKRKKTLSLAVCILLIFTMLFPSYAKTAAPAIKIVFGGEQLTLNHVPVSESGVVLVPMKTIFDSLDAYVEFNSKTKTLSAMKGKVTLKLTQGSTTGILNGKSVKVPVAPKLIDKEVFVPLDFICKSFEFDYKWDKKTSVATISARNAQANGNTSGNNSNYGYAVSGGDWTYISLYNAGVFKISQDDSQRVKINDKAANFLNLSGDWIYYVNTQYTNETDNLRLYKMKTDGSSKTKISKDQISYLNLEGDWLFYINRSDSNKPYKMRIDGKGIKKLSNDSLQNLYVDDGWIYYQKEYDENIYRMRTSGYDIKKLTDDSAKYSSQLIKSGDWIYYISNNYSMNKMKINGSDKKTVIEGIISSMNLIDGCIYYTDYKGSLYKLDEKNHFRTKIGYGLGEGLNEANDWLYYSVYSDDDYSCTDYRIKTDGRIKQKFNEDGSVSDKLRVTPDENLPSFTPKSLSVPTSSSGVLTPKEIARHKDAVVHIKVFDDEGNVMATGSGFNIEESGVIATNFHVISGASSIKCTFDDNTSYDVDFLLNYNELKDIVLLHLKDAKNLPVVYLWDSDKVELAESVLAIGNPMQLQNTVSGGIISGIRTFWGVKYIQTTASISSGSSGGPLFNMNGNVIGITSLTVNGAQNINFAMPSNYVRKLYETAQVIPLSTVNNYDSDIPEFEDNNNTQTANEFIPNQSINGSVQNIKDVDYFKFTLKHDEKVSFFGVFYSYDDEEDDENLAKALEMTLISQDGTQIARSSLSVEEGDYSVQKISEDLKEGTYYVVVKKSSANKQYSELDDYSISSVID